MATGPGKYDDAATAARESTGARALVLIVLGGSKGSGFSVQTPVDLGAGLPELLRRVADEIEASL